MKPLPIRRANSRRLLRAPLLSSLLFMSLPLAVQAQALMDPTRPPVLLAAPDEAPAAAPAAGPVLESVLVSPARRLATISGKTVQVGDKFGEARVTSISENEVVLHDGRQARTLKLFPAIARQRVARMAQDGPAAQAGLPTHTMR